MHHRIGSLTLMALLAAFPASAETPFTDRPVTPGQTTTTGITPDMPGIEQLPADQLPGEGLGGPRQYRVIAGDTLSDIARAYLGDPNRFTEIVELNSQRYPWLAKNPDLIFPGMQLVLPPEPGTPPRPAPEPSIPQTIPIDSSAPAVSDNATPASPNPPRLDNGGWIFAKLTSYAETGKWNDAELALKYARDYRTRVDPSLLSVFDASYEKSRSYLISCEAKALENELVILQQKTAARDPNLQATIDWIKAHVDRLTRLGEAANHADLLTRANAAIDAAQKTIPRFGGSQPYFNQNDNQIDPSYTCQNTAIAMTLKNYGWNGTPDDITRRYGRSYGQTPAGIADIFNTLAREAGLKIRTRAHDAATMTQVDSWLAQGKQVIVQGWFTASGGGHVIVLNKKVGASYDCHDPNGTWTGGYNSGYSSSSGGSHVRYDGKALEGVIVEGGGVYAQELYYVD